MNRYLVRCLAAILVVASSFTYSKDKSLPVVGIMKFTGTTTEQEARAAELQETVIEAFVDCGQFIVLDRAKADQIQKELYDQKGGEYLNGKTVAQDRLYGAQILISGAIVNIEVTAKKAQTRVIGRILRDRSGLIPNSATTYTTKLSYALEARDVATGKIIIHKIFDFSNASGTKVRLGNYDEFSSEEDANKNAIRSNKAKIIEETKNWANQLSSQLNK